MKQVILYGLSGANKQYKALSYFCVYDNLATTQDLKDIARGMREDNPSIEHVYMVTNRYDLKREYIQSIKRNSIESCAIFKDTLEREGIMVI